MLNLAPNLKFEFAVGRVSCDDGYLKPWQKFVFNRIYKPFARFCHFRLGLPTTAQIVDSVECQHCHKRTILPYKGYRQELESICTDESVSGAIIAAGGEDWYDHKLPVNATLPGSNVRLRGAKFKAAGKDRNFNGSGPKLVVVCPVTGEACRQHDSIRRSDLVKVLNQAERNTNKLTVAL